MDDNYLFYSAIEVYKYETSQREITIGLINPIEQFEKICCDFKINFENECTFIDFNQANDGERGFDLYNGTTKYLSVIAAKKSVTGYETEGAVNFDATTDVLGTEYKRAKNSSIKVNLSNLPAGTYYIKVANGHNGDMFFNTITITTLK